VAKLRPNYDDVQAHYDLSDEFFELFLDPTKAYSCAFFQREDMTLEEAQKAKIDLSLGKCDLKPGMLLLDVGCGWGETCRRAVDLYGVRAIGLTLSKNQQQYSTEKIGQREGLEFRLQGWEEFNEPVDRIVSIGALEHFRLDRYLEFFRRCNEVLPADGQMMIHSIVHGTPETLQPGEPELCQELIDYMRFIKKQIFPGGQVPPREIVIQCAEAAGFEVVHLESLRLHYARTLETWAANLEARREAAIQITSQEVYDTYMRYLTESAHFFRTGHVDVVQFTMAKK
jgi:cyclopropane-fatty-acyl-phospholipid synthase